MVESALAILSKNHVLFHSAVTDPSPQNEDVNREGNQCCLST